MLNGETNRRESLELSHPTNNNCSLKMRRLWGWLVESGSSWNLLYLLKLRNSKTLAVIQPFERSGERVAITFTLWFLAMLPSATMADSIRYSLVISMVRVWFLYFIFQLFAFIQFILLIQTSNSLVFNVCRRKASKPPFIGLNVSEKSITITNFRLTLS